MMSSWDQYVSVGKCVYKKLGWSFTQFPLLMKGRDSQTKIRGGPVSPCTSYQLLGRMSHPSDSHLSWVVRQQNRCRKTARVCWEKQQIRIPGKKKTQKKLVENWTAQVLSSFCMGSVVPPCTPHIDSDWSYSHRPGTLPAPSHVAKFVLVPWLQWIGE